MERLRQTPRTTLLAITAVAIAFGLAFGYWIGEDDPDYVGWISARAVGTLIAAGLLLRFVPATEAEGDGNAPARRALVLGVIALVTIVVFWTGLPIVLGVPALVLAAEARARAATYGRGGEATAGALLGGLAALAAIVLLIAGA